MKKQTAVIWLQEALEQTILTPEQIMQTIGLFVQALEMEKEQIIDAWKNGDGEFDKASDSLSELYYKETYKSE